MSRPRVLIIDDDPSVTQILHDQLKSEGLRVTVTSHAEEGFDSAVKDPPELVLLDVNLPGATGFQICDRLRKNESTHAVPIVMMSGAAKWPNQQQIGKSLGANDYIIKPFEAKDVSAKVHSLLGTTPMPPEEEELPPPAPEPVPEEPATPPPAPVAAEPLVTDQPLYPLEPPPAPAPQISPDPELPALALSESTGPNDEAAPAPRFEPRDSSEVLRVRPALTVGSDSPLPLLVWVLLVIHTGLSMAGLYSEGVPASGELLRTALQTIGGWALLLGLLVGVSAVVGIRMTPRTALRLMGLAGIPILLRAVLRFVILFHPSLAAVGAAINVTRLDMPLSCMRPLDIFELFSVVLLGFQMRGYPSATTSKIIWAIGLIILAWLFAAQGYFQPL